MTAYGDLAAAPMYGYQGVPAGYDNWRFVVRVVTAQSTLGTFILGTNVLADVAWSDVTADVEGISIQRGTTTAGERAGAGQMSLRLNNDAGTYSAWKSLYNGPGTLIQIGFCQPTTNTTVPIFTGYTISWNESQDGRGNSRWVDIDTLETMALLREYNPAGISPIGAGEIFTQRSSRILAAASWQFPVNTLGAFGAEAAFTLQATALAQDALTEYWLTMDSVSISALPGKDGSINLRSQRNAGNVTFGAETLATLGTDVPAIADSIVTANDDEKLLGSISLARVGGTAVTYTNTGIDGRYQSRATQRYDLITQDPGANADLARYANDVLTRSRSVYRVQRLELDTLQGAQVWKFLSGLDIFSLVNIQKPDPTTGGILFSNYTVCGYTLNIEPLNQFSGIHIRATLETEPSQTSTWIRY